MQKSLPDLMQLRLSTPSYGNEIALPDPDSFSGGSEPCLRLLALSSIPFPELPELLLSTQLNLLCLRSILDSGHILPETIAACLSALTNLELLSFGPPSPRPRLPPPPTRSIPPALTDETPRSGVSESVKTEIRT